MPEKIEVVPEKIEVMTKVDILRMACDMCSSGDQRAAIDKAKDVRIVYRELLDLIEETTK